MATSIGKVSLEAKLTIKVGEQQVELAELAAALTRAGVELQSLIKPDPGHRRCPTVETTTYGGDQRAEAACLVDGLAPGEGVYRAQNGKLHRVRLDELSLRPDEVPRVEGFLSELV